MFRSARLKLTGWYILIIMLISMGFSLFIYRAVNVEINRLIRIQGIRIEKRLQNRVFFTQPVTPPGIIMPLKTIDLELLEETKQRVAWILVGINTAILVVAGGLAYFVAGRTLRPIKVMLDEQNRFIADASHELRTPLTALKSSIEVSLRDEKMTVAEARTLLSDNLTEVNELQTLSDALLELAQYDKPNGKHAFAPVSLPQVVDEILKKVHPLARNKEITITTDVADITVAGSKENLMSLLTILLDNAIKYSPEKTTVTVTVAKTDHSARIQIKDEGVGIAEKDIPHIFDRFYRADSARSKREAGGYGLGLSIAKKIVENHHGTIHIKSELRKGTTFTIHIPVQ